MERKTPHGGPSRLRPAESERDRRLAAGGPKRVLSLDGGGVRGMISIGILSAIETRLARRSPDPDAFRLSHYFDLIGGTSTGSIIAALLAMGWRVKEIEDLYLRLAPKVFSSTGSVGFHKPKFDAGRLEAIIGEFAGGIELESDALKTGFALYAKRIDTGAAWVLSNHPDSKFWEAEPGATYLPNKKYEIGKLVRASAAAPYFFEAAEIDISDTRDGMFDPDTGIFLDGAVGGANNPSVHLLTLATLGDYPFQWSPGADNLFIVSVGTGTKRIRVLPRAWKEGFWASNIRKAVRALQGMITDTGQHAVTTMQALSAPPDPSAPKRWNINLEIGDMPSAPIANPPLCTFLRLDASLEEDDVRPIIRGEFKSVVRMQKAIDALEQIDNGQKKNLARLLRIGFEAGGKVEDRDLPARFDVGGGAAAEPAPAAAVNEDGAEPPDEPDPSAA